MLFTDTSCFVPNWLVNFVDDLLALNQSVWAKATHKWLMEDVPQTTSQVHEKC